MARGITSHANGFIPRCVAVHIRRGDRVPDRAVKNATAAALGKNKGKRLPLLNYGMIDGHVLFGAITLAHVVTVAKRLVHPDVRTMLVVTDDEEWLRKQQSELETASDKKMENRIFAGTCAR